MVSVALLAVAIVMQGASGLVSSAMPGSLNKLELSDALKPKSSTPAAEPKRFEEQIKDHVLRSVGVTGLGRRSMCLDPGTQTNVELDGSSKMRQNANTLLRISVRELILILGAATFGHLVVLPLITTTPRLV